MTSLVQSPHNLSDNPYWSHPLKVYSEALLRHKSYNITLLLKILEELP
jgi:hypothetical protein